MNATQLLAHFDSLAEAPGAVPRLRRFILDLAVRGKLVAQDAELEGTDIELPTGWAWSKLGDLCTKTGSGSTPAGGKDAYVASGVPFLRSQNVYDDGLRLDGVAFISDTTQERMSSTTVKACDLLLNITGGSIGRCAIVPDSFVVGNINQHVAIIRLARLKVRAFCIALSAQTIFSGIFLAIKPVRVVRGFRKIGWTKS
jgi:type I restriction enzyme S subunit